LKPFSPRELKKEKMKNKDVKVKKKEKLLLKVNENFTSNTFLRKSSHSFIYENIP